MGFTETQHVRVVDNGALTWPSDLQISGPYFRLFVAADTSKVSTTQISQFAQGALASGMVYCCCWGPGCEKLHDIIDEVIVAEELKGKPIPRPSPNDTVMTTWHDNESLQEAVEFFLVSAVPTAGYGVNSCSAVAMSVSNSGWGETIRETLTQLGATLDVR